MSAGRWSVAGFARISAGVVGAVVAAAAWGSPSADAAVLGNASVSLATLEQVHAGAAAAQKVSSRPDMISAAVSARAQGSPVEALDQRTAYSTSWANPDGTVTVRVSRVKISGRAVESVLKENLNYG